MNEAPHELPVKGNEFASSQDPLTRTAGLYGAEILEAEVHAVVEVSTDTVNIKVPPESRQQRTGSLDGLTRSIA